MEVSCETAPLLVFLITAMTHIAALTTRDYFSIC